jgi:hypothetical protein
MQHEQVSLDQGTPLLRTDGLVLISNTVKGPRHAMYPFRTCYSVLTYSLVHPFQAAASLPHDQYQPVLS